MIVDPHGHIADEDRNTILTRFEQVRGPNHDGGAPLYIVSPSDRQGIDDALSVPDNTTPRNSTGKAAAAWNPSFTASTPEWVVLTRTISLARKTRAFLNSKLTLFENTGWPAAFHETPTSFKAYSALLRVNTDLVVDAASCSTGTDLSTSMGIGVPDTCYTKSMREVFLGPQKLRLKLYRNMRDDEAGQVLYDFTPVIALVESLRQKFGTLGLFFFNSLCPEVIAILWRPHVLGASPFSAITSEFAQPCLASGWKSDTMVVYNTNDILREMSQHFDGVVTKVKVFQTAPSPERKEIESSPKGKRKAGNEDESSSDDDSKSMD
jgi:Nrap protein domain 6